MICKNCPIKHNYKDSTLPNNGTQSCYKCKHETAIFCVDQDGNACEEGNCMFEPREASKCKT